MDDLEAWERFKLRHAVRGQTGGMAQASLEGEKITLIITPHHKEDFSLNFTTPCCRVPLVAVFGAHSFCDQCANKMLGTIGPREWSRDGRALKDTILAHLEAWDTNPLVSELVAGVAEDHVHRALRAMELYAHGRAKTLGQAYREVRARPTQALRLAPPVWP